MNLPKGLAAATFLTVLFTFCPADADEGEATLRFQAGVAASKRGDHARALAEFSHADLAGSTPNTLYNLGRESQILGESKSAIEYYNRYLQQQPTTSDRSRVEAQIVKLGGTVKPLPMPPGPPPPTPQRRYPVKEILLGDQVIDSDQTIIAETVRVKTGATITVRHGSSLRILAGRLVVNGHAEFVGVGDKGNPGSAGSVPAEWSTSNARDWQNSCGSSVDRGGDGGAGGPGGKGATIEIRYEAATGKLSDLVARVDGGAGGDGGPGGRGRLCVGPDRTANQKYGQQGNPGQVGPSGPLGTFSTAKY